jgi:hypothetical protein
VNMRLEAFSPRFSPDGIDLPLQTRFSARPLRPSAYGGEGVPYGETHRTESGRSAGE